MSAQHDAMEQTARIYILGHMSLFWPDVSMYQENEEFRPPERGATELAMHWGRLFVIWGDTGNADIGASSRYRYVGQIVVQLFAPAGRGTGNLMKIADSLVEAFEDMNDTYSIWIRPASVTKIGVEDGHMQINVSAPFQFDAPII